ncbi:Mov34/MPN/PAD-1 family protein [Teladorsagia circumcincta]|uniref:Mov34/MPN/PAD-1 family protein n=1 Tax=Teladorsagia circumcincta TaxID=45464 RepID=A0A2G9V0T1_TELCI|nr:Mov34/MPN/PAD-1 family protein [Teladorsagia circumcincta]
MGTKEVSDDPSHPDSAETVHISALALLKMMRHARSGVPLEVMGLMLGSFVDDYTINVVDVFAMPQSGTSVTVESVDPVYQTKHMELLKQTGRTEMVVGWYHSHPGFGCWLSSVDVSTQQSFEALHPRAVALVVDPIQSVKGNVMLDAFRSINPLAVNPRLCAPTAEARQTTSNMGHLVRPSLVSTVHGLGLRYYSMNCAYKLTTREQKMLLCLNQKTWIDGMDMTSDKPVSTDEQQIKRYGRLNAKQKLEEIANKVMADNIVQQISAVINSQSIQ